jgi:Aldehyde dehydrogenase family
MTATTGPKSSPARSSRWGPRGRATAAASSPRTSSARVMSEREIFGPILAVTTFTDDAQAMDIANRTEYGLVSYAYTKDLGRADRLISPRGSLRQNTSAAANRTPSPPPWPSLTRLSPAGPRSPPEPPCCGHAPPFRAGARDWSATAGVCRVRSPNRRRRSGSLRSLESRKATHVDRCAAGMEAHADVLKQALRRLDSTRGRNGWAPVAPMERFLDQHYGRASERLP